MTKITPLEFQIMQVIINTKKPASIEKITSEITLTRHPSRVRLSLEALEKRKFISLQHRGFILNKQYRPKQLNKDSQE